MSCYILFNKWIYVLCYVDAVEVTNAIYGKDDEIVLGCGVASDNSTALKFSWLKNGNQIHSDDHRVIAEHKDSNYSFSTVTITKIGKML